MKLTLLNIEILVFYMLVMAWIRVYIFRRHKDTEEYFVGGRSFPGWAIGLSMVGTSISSVTFLAFPADAYKTGWLRFLPNLMLPAAGVAMIGGAMFFAGADAKALQDVPTIIASLLGAELLGMYTLGYFTRCGGIRTVWVGIVCTIVFTTWTIVTARNPDLLPPTMNVLFDLYHISIFGNVVMFVVGFFIGSLLPASADRCLDHLTIWDRCKLGPSTVETPHE